MSETVAGYEPFAYAALAAFGLDGATLRLLSFSENATYLAERGDDHVVIRVHRPGYNSLRETESELCWMENVRATSTIRTPEVRKALDGRVVVEVALGDETRNVDAFEFIPGIGAEDQRSGISYRDLGAVTATLHQHVQQWVPPEGFSRFRWDLDSMLGAGGRWGDWRDAPNLTGKDRGVIEAAEARVRERLEAFGTNPNRFGLVHADLRMSNLIVQDGEIVVIDFDDCGWSWYLTDLAAIITWNESDPESYSIVEEWLGGYTSVTRLESEDFAEIPTFVMLRRLMTLAWIGTHPESEPAKNLRGHYAADTAGLANRYLHDPTWFAYGPVDQPPADTRSETKEDPQHCEPADA